MPSTTPKQLATQVRARLREAGDVQAAARGRTYFKRGDDVELYGVKSSALRGIEKEAYGEVRADWTVSHAISFCELMAETAQLEAKMVGVLLLGRYHEDFPRGLLAVVRGWILAGSFRNWAVVDGLAPTVVTPLVVKYDELMPRVVRWTSSNNLWLRRAAAVTFVPLARKGRELDCAYTVVERLLSDPNDLIHKASGWLLREAGRTDMARLEDFLLNKGPHIPRTTVRYAIERFPARKRKSLLIDTRSRSRS